MFCFTALVAVLPLLASAVPLPLPLLGLGDDNSGGLLGGLGGLGSGGDGIDNLPLNTDTLPLGNDDSPLDTGLPVLGSLTNVTAGITADVGSILSVALGINLDLIDTTQLLCSLVSGTFSDRPYDLGCTCLGSDGGILLDVDVDVEAIVNVVGLDVWVQAQVSRRETPRAWDSAREILFVGTDGFCRFIWEGSRLGIRKMLSRPVMGMEGSTVHSVRRRRMV